MASASPNGQDNVPVPFKDHRSSSVFGSTGIVSGRDTSGAGFWVCSVIGLALIVTGAALILVAAPGVISLIVIGAGILCVITGAVLLGRERAVAIKRQRSRRATATQPKISQPSAKR